MASTAVAQVFESALLLGRIFRQGLSPAEVTRARQVNTFIKTVIDNSKPLRRIMFLEPEPTPERLIRDNGSNAEFTVMKAHPAILASTSSSNGSDYCFAIKDKLANTNWNQGMWQSMLICQPPAEEIALHFTRQVSWAADWEPPQSGLNIRVKGNTLGALMTTINHLQSDSEAIMTRVWDLKVSVKGCLEEENTAVLPARLYTQVLAKAAKIKQRTLEAAAAAKRQADVAKSEANRTTSKAEVERSKIAYNTEVERKQKALKASNERNKVSFKAEIERNRMAVKADRATRKAAAAAKRVFGITELLEQILLGLSTADLTQCWQVSRGFKATIDESLLLRRAMFLEPSSETLAYADAPTKHFSVIKINPAIKGKMHDDGIIYLDYYLSFRKKNYLPSMLICQPPCSKLELVYHRQYTSMQSSMVNKHLSYHVLKGNTLGDLSAAVAKLRATRTACGFRLETAGGRYPFEEDESLVVQSARDALAAALPQTVQTEVVTCVKSTALTAAVRVFGVTELLEHILLGLSTADIARGRRVSRTFKDTIDESLHLRRAMFLEPEPVGETLNYAAEPNQSAKKFTVVTVHPAIRGHMYNDGEIHLDLSKKPWMSDKSREMLICQPPCADLRLAWYSRIGSMTWRKWYRMKGNTLGELGAAVTGFTRTECAQDFRLEAHDGDLAFEEEGSLVVELARNADSADAMAAVCKANQERHGVDGIWYREPRVPGQRENKFGLARMWSARYSTE